MQEKAYICFYDSVVSINKSFIIHTSKRDREVGLPVGRRMHDHGNSLTVTRYHISLPIVHILALPVSMTLPILFHFRLSDPNII